MSNVTQAVPFFWVRDLDASLRFYVDGLGFTLKNKWLDDGKLRLCWLELGGAAVMLQEFRHDRVPAEKTGVGVSVCFMCKDAIAIWKDVTGRGIDAKRPFVGNGLWVTSVVDPDGYHLDFESPTDAPEESEYSA
jgi:catechol 2,3-dioxygenase-like lactoylglutathione lyase family enzyme